MHIRKENSCITGFVAGRRVELLIRRLLFFIYNDQPQIAKRQQYSRARAKHNLIFIIDYLLPYLYPLVIIKPGMIDADTGAKVNAQTLNDVCSKRNFGQQKKHTNTQKKEKKTQKQTANKAPACPKKTQPRSA